MNKEEKAQIDTLNELIEINLDGENGYREAAREVNSEELTTIFNRLSQQRKGFAESLKEEVIHLGGDVAESQSVEGFLHNNWLKVKSYIASGDEEKILESCQTGEEYAAKQYSERISDAHYPSYLRSKLVKQYDMIKGAYEQLEGLKTEFA